MGRPLAALAVEVPVPIVTVVWAEAAIPRVNSDKTINADRRRELVKIILG
jgi:hypothetical protein